MIRATEDAEVTMKTARALELLRDTALAPSGVQPYAGDKPGTMVSPPPQNVFISRLSMRGEALPDAAKLEMTFSVTLLLTRSTAVRLLVSPCCSPL
jgi:hypothetical protein